MRSFMLGGTFCVFFCFAMPGCHQPVRTTDREIPDKVGTVVEEPIHLATHLENTPLESHVPPESFRFDLRVDDARVSAAPAADDSTFEYRQDYRTDSTPWTISKGNARCEIADDALVIETDTLAYCDSPPISGARAISVPAILVNARITGCTQFTLAWRGQNGEFSPDSEAQIDVIRSDDFIVYNIDTGFFATWNSHLGNVAQLRIILPENAKMEIRSLGLADRVDRFAGKSFGRMEYTRRKWHYTHALYARTPASLEYDVAVMPDARLTTELQVPSSVPTTFRFLLKDGTHETIVAEETLDDARPREVVLDLSKWSGKDVQIRLESESEKPGTVALWFTPRLARVYPVTEATRPMNVIWYVIDCVRPENLPAYGYERNTTPYITEIAKEGALFEWCFAPGTWTVDSVASFFTGLSPNAHGMMRIHSVLPKSMHRLPEIMREAGYTTALFSQNPYVDKSLGYVQGFDESQRSRVRGAGRREVTLDKYPLNEGIAEFLQKHREEPLFLYVHTIEPHGPYIPPPSFRFFDQPDGSTTEMDLYDDCLAWADANLRYTIGRLQEEGLWNNTLLIVSADHGQSFAEEDDGMTGHGEQPYISRAWIPLIMRLPGTIPEGVRIEENVQALDIPQTLFALLGLEPDPQFGGDSLVGLLEGDPNSEFANRSLFSTGQLTKWQAVIQGRWFYHDNDGKGELIDLKTNPKQTANVIEQHPDIAQALRQETIEYREQEDARAAQFILETPESMDVDLETRKQLEALGYN
jgi:arylsulfatase A-like enzyme